MKWGVWIVAGLCLIPGLFSPPNMFDEGLIAVGADRVLHGEWPYRDFWAVYPPGQFWSVAALFHVVGESLSVLRFYDLLVRATLCMLVYMVAGRWLGPRRALVPTALAILLLASFGYHGYPAFPAMAFALCAVWLIDDQRYGFAGAAIGCAMLYKHEVALFFGAAFAVAAFFTGDGAGVLKKFLRFGFGTAVVTLPAGAWLFAHVAPATAINNLLTASNHLVLEYRGIPPPIPFPIDGVFSLDSRTPWTFADTVGLYVPMVALLVSAIAGLKARRDIIPLLLCLWGALSFYQAFARADDVHLFVPQFISILAVARVWPEKPTRLVVGSLMLAVALFAIRPAEQFCATVRTAKIGHTHGRAGFAPLDPDMEQTLPIIRANIPPGEKIFVGLRQHDRVFVNDVMFYFLADRRPATRYHEFVPGITTERAAQEEMIGEVEQVGVRFVFLRMLDHVPSEPNRSSISSGVTLFDDYLHANFDVVDRLGTIHVLRRK